MLQTAWMVIFAELDRLHSEREAAIGQIHNFQKPLAQVPLAQVVKEFRQVSAEYDREIDESVREWNWGHKLPPIGPVADNWRFQRVFAARAFVTHLTAYMSVETSSKVFSKPEITNEACIKWLLTHWWREHGIMFFGLLFKSQ